MIFTYISSEKKFRERFFSLIEKLFPVIRGVRINGSICLDLVQLCDTENASHITLSFRGFVWDVAAGYLIVKESGGIFADLQGDEMNVDYLSATKQYSFIAAHPHVIVELKKYLS